MGESEGRGALRVEGVETGVLGFGDLRMGTRGSQLVLADTRVTAIAPPSNPVETIQRLFIPLLLFVHLGPLPDFFNASPPSPAVS